MMPKCASRFELNLHNTLIKRKLMSKFASLGNRVPIDTHVMSCFSKHRIVSDVRKRKMLLK